jgi:bifunctional non-homologous end joining protein LigD
VSPTAVEVDIEGRRVRLSNLDKVFYPAVGFTKGQVIDYYTRIAPVLLPHLHDRQLTLKRYPNGVDGPYFYEKRCPKHRPEWVPVSPVWHGRDGKQIEFCLANDLPTLIWAANLANLELHTSLSRADRPPVPTILAFDLDPGEGAGMRACARVGLILRDLLAAHGLEAWPKTSGSKGLQVYVPLNTDDVTYDDTKSFSRAVAELLEREYPALVLSRMARADRPGKVFIDWSQNDEAKTTACVYSLRARDRPTASTPVTWAEVEEAGDAKTADVLSFTSTEVLERVERDGDLFGPVLTRRQPLAV